MTDPMERLKKAMQAAPAPREKNHAVDAAMRAFDEEFQETAAPARQTTQMQPIWETIMSLLSNNLRPMLMGGASVAALSLAVFVAVNVETAEQPFPQTLESAVEVTDKGRGEEDSDYEFNRRAAEIEEYEARGTVGFELYLGSQPEKSTRVEPTAPVGGLVMGEAAPSADVLPAPSAQNGATVLYQDVQPARRKERVAKALADAGVRMPPRSAGLTAGPGRICGCFGFGYLHRSAIVWARIDISSQRALKP